MSSQLDVLCKCTEAALHPLTQLTAEGVKQTDCAGVEACLQA